MVRAPGCGSGGRGFDSPSSPHFFIMKNEKYFCSDYTDSDSPNFDMRLGAVLLKDSRPSPDHEPYDFFIDGVFHQYGITGGNVAEFSKKSGVPMEDILSEAVISKESAEDMALELATKNELFDAYMKSYENISYPFDKNSDIDKPELSSLKLYKERLSKTGLDEITLKEIFDSWQTYNAFTLGFMSEGKMIELRSQPSQEKLSAIATTQAAALCTQLESLESMVNKYGLGSTKSIIENFGIHHFERYDHKHLARQNKAWNDSEPVEAVVVNARYDWNSINKPGPSFEENFKNRLFYFEVGNANDIGHVAVAIGKQARQAGRMPSVKYFIIHAHGTPDNMIIGTNKEQLLVKDYDLISRFNFSGNDYKKHLGENYKLILQSCSTAGNNNGKESIANIMGKHHQVPVHAPESKIYGVDINSDGTTIFMTQFGTEGGKTII